MMRSRKACTPRHRGGCAKMPKHPSVDKTMCCEDVHPETTPPVAMPRNDESGHSFTRYSLWTRPLAYWRVATCMSATSRDNAPKSGIPDPINTGTRVIVSL